MIMLNNEFAMGGLVYNSARGRLAMALRHRQTGNHKYNNNMG